MKYYRFELSGTFSGKTKRDAMQAFWEWVDGAEDGDLKIEEESKPENEGIVCLQK